MNNTEFYSPSNTQEAGQIPTPAPIKLRTPIFDFLLIFCTLGTYSGFWLVSNVRSFNRVTEHNLRPNWWFPVPFVFIAQLFALPALNKAYEEEERRLGVSVTHGRNILWLIALLILTFSTNIIDYKYDAPYWVYLIGLTLLAGLLTCLGSRLNRIKRACLLNAPELPTKSFDWWEWVIIALVAPIFIGFYFWVNGVYLPTNTLQVLQDGEEFTLEDHSFILPFEGQGWKQVKSLGDNDENSLVSFIGPSEGLNIRIYQYDADDDINDIVYESIVTFMSVDPNIKCFKQEKFIPDTFVIRLTTICDSKTTLGPNKYVSVVIRNEDTIYEAYAMFRDAHTASIGLMKTMENVVQGLRFQ